MSDVQKGTEHATKVLYFANIKSAYILSCTILNSATSLQMKYNVKTSKNSALAKDVYINEPFYKWK